jgi:hypothetical protein
MTTQRAFNSLEISAGEVSKRSLSKNSKIEAESHWYHSLPYALRKYVPAILSEPDQLDKNGNSVYTIEYLPLPTLSEAYVFHSYTKSEWSLILSEIGTAITCFREYPAGSDRTADINYDSMAKTKLRYLQTMDEWDKIFPDQTQLKADYVESFSAFEEIYSCSVRDNAELNLVHGDMCFSNILYDHRTRRVRFIDPRGEDFDGCKTAYGDSRYDLAKLAHSILGGYDHIIAGFYGITNQGIQLHVDAELHRWLENYFWESVVKKLGYKKREIQVLCAGLFSAMIPFHYDRPDRQIAFIHNFIRLVKGIE